MSACASRKYHGDAAARMFKPDGGIKLDANANAAGYAAVLASMYVRSGITECAVGIPPAAKCPGCGSHSFIQRGQHHVCTYCRGEQ